MSVALMVAKNAGLCFGVKRALKLAQNAAKHSQKPVYTFGPIIHNPQVVDWLKDQGVFPLDETEVKCLEKGTLIIRSHGIPKDMLDTLVKKGITIIDATCPFVKKAQNIVQSLADKKTPVLIFGDKAHPEVIALLSYAGDHVIVVNSAEECSRIKPLPPEVSIVSQTTQSIEKLKKLEQFLAEQGVVFHTFNTICDSTENRQKEALSIAKTVDAVVVIGGHNSANTARLFEMCKMIAPNTIHIETDAEIDPAWFQSKKSIGIVSGASTPDWIIKKIIRKFH